MDGLKEPRTMMHHFQGRDFLKLADFTPEEVGYIVDTAIELKRKRAVGEAFEPLARQDRGADLREALDAHAPELPGRHRPARRPDLLHEPRPDADQPRRADPRHGAHHRPLLRGPLHPHVRPGDRRGVRPVHAQPGDQRPDQRDPPLPGPLRPHDDQGEEGRLQGPQGRLPGRHLERLPLAHDGQRHDGHGLLRGSAQRRLPAQRRAARHGAEVGRAAAARRSSTRGASKRWQATPT